MFEFLNALGTDDLLGAVSYAIRGLTHLGRAGGARRLLTLPDEFTPAQVLTGQRIISDIEAAEREPVNEMDSDQVRRYVGELYGFLDARWGEDGSHSAEANRMLAQFRQGRERVAFLAPRPGIGPLR
jgi:hypothetical protein